MKYNYLIFNSEPEALKRISGKTDSTLENINKSKHHSNRVKLYSGTGLVKKYRPNRKNMFLKAHDEAAAHINLEKIGVGVPKLRGMIHTSEECSVIFDYVDSDLLINNLHSNSPAVLSNIFSLGTYLGKMFENRFLHRDLTAYHIFAGDKVYLFDLESTRSYNNDEFYMRLPTEWNGLVRSVQGGRWIVPFTKIQEETLFAGVKEELSSKKTLNVLEKTILNSKCKHIYK